MATIPLSPMAPSTSQLSGPNYRLTILTDGLIRFEWSDDGGFEDRASTFTIRRDLRTPRFEKIETEHSLEILTGRFHLEFDKKPFSPSGFTVLLRQKLGDHSSRWRYGVPVPNLDGTARTLDGVNGRCELTDGILSKEGFAVIDDSASMLLTSDGWVGSRRPGRSDHYLFAYGRDYRAALKTFYAVSGSSPVLPRWTLGNWWSRYYPYTADGYISLMDRFKEEKIPLAVAVLDMDWHLVDIPPEYGAGWTGYTWNKELFPDPPGFMKKLHDRHLKITPNTHPADGVRAYEALYKKMAIAMGRDPSTGHVIAFDCTDKVFMDAYFNVLHHSLEDEGIDFWWLDWQQGTYSKTPGIDPLWMLNHFHFLDSGRESRRPLTFSRFAGPGSQRYPVGFSGDTEVTWDSLHFQPEFTATASNIGFGWWSHDIGGHYFGIKDDELAARWVQLGVWSPILRLHSNLNDFNTREPWRYCAETQVVMTESLRFRHRLLPYLYSMSVRASIEGTAIVEPMYYDQPDEPEAYKYRNQFRFGSQLHVSPITTPRERSTRMGKAMTWMPAGRFVDIFTGMVYDGGRTVSLHRTLGHCPVLAGQGAIVPLDNTEVLENGCPIPGSIEILLVVGADGHFEMVEDDGTGSDLKEMRLTRTIISFDQSSGVLTIEPPSEPLVQSREWSVRLVAYTPKGLVSARSDGKDVPVKITDGSNLHLGSVSSNAPIIINLGSQSPQLDRNDTKSRIFALLDGAQMDQDWKLTIWKTIKKDLPLNLLISDLSSMEVDMPVYDAIMEILLADAR